MKQSAVFKNYFKIKSLHWCKVWRKLTLKKKKKSHVRENDLCIIFLRTFPRMIYDVLNYMTIFTCFRMQNMFFSSECIMYTKNEYVF